MACSELHLSGREAFERVVDRAEPGGRHRHVARLDLIGHPPKLLEDVARRGVAGVVDPKHLRTRAVDPDGDRIEHRNRDRRRVAEIRAIEGVRGRDIRSSREDLAAGLGRIRRSDHRLRRRTEFVGDGLSSDGVRRTTDLHESAASRDQAGRTVGEGRIVGEQPGVGFGCVALVLLEAFQQGSIDHRRHPVGRVVRHPVNTFAGHDLFLGAVEADERPLDVRQRRP